MGSLRPVVVALIVFAGVVRAAGADRGSSYAELDPARISTVAGWLPESPAGLGRPISDRTYWTVPQTLQKAGDCIAQAQKLINQPFPAWDDDVYLDYSRTGVRVTGEKMISARSAWLKPLVLAECVENKGRFLPAIKTVLEGYVSQPTWTLPAHDADLKSFHRTTYTVELASAMFAADLSEALWLLGDRLDADLRQRVFNAVEQRVITPVRQSLITGKGHWWLGTADHPVVNNWNAVCLSGVVGAAMTILPDRADRAIFATAGEHYITCYLNSFHPSGYIDEGGGYWSFGFGRMALLRETLVQSTAGRIELFDSPRIRAAALFGARYQLTDHLVPTFADCRFGAHADAQLIGYCNQVLDLHLPAAVASPKIAGDSLYSALLAPTSYLRAQPGAAATGEAPDAVGVRSYFDDAGVLVARPSNPACHLGVAIKAGGNSSHSHNDVGSFVITLGGEMPVGDPGGPFAYDSKTFSDQRYTFKLLNSFGHPVPVVAGKLQRDATHVHPKVLHTSFTDEYDEIAIDMTAAYDVPGLISLVRTLRYQRTGTGLVTIRDEVRFENAATFEESLTSHGTVTIGPGTNLTFTSGKSVLRATIKTPDGFEPTSEKVTELGAPTFTRLGLKLQRPVKTAIVELTFEPG